MRKKVFTWLEREFVSLSGEGEEGLNSTDETLRLLKLFAAELNSVGLSLDNTVRTRLFGRDVESRKLASAQRGKVLSDRARSVSSSYIAPTYFNSRAHVAMDLIAMRPGTLEVQKTLREYDPPAAPLRFLIYDSVAFFSGVTGAGSSLHDQIAKIVDLISGSLSEAKSSWEKVAKISFFLHSSQDLRLLQELFKKRITASVPRLEYSFVDGYAGEGNLLEIEATART